MEGMVQGPGRRTLWGSGPSVSRRDTLLQGRPFGMGEQGGPSTDKRVVCAPQGEACLARVPTVFDRSFLTVRVICLENNLGLFIFNYKNKMVYFLL